MSIYNPLDSQKREFRILRVNTSGRDEQGHIQCRLEHATFSGLVPPYKAVSWCWGDTTQRSSIVIHDQIVDIPQSAEMTLGYICLVHGHEHVWLDAICINQQNLLECGKQVAMMQEIYSRATEVLVWLGEPKPDNLEYSELYRVEGLCRECYEHAGSDDLVSLFWGPDGRPRYTDKESLMTLEPDVYSVPWFTRLWVVQEVMLNAEVTCYYGRATISWAKLSLAAQWLWFKRYRRDRMLQEASPGIESASQIWRYTHRGYDFMNLLDMSIKLRTTKPVDKIYGIHGLLQSANAAARANISLDPDYRTDMTLVYLNATRVALALRSGRTDQLDILRFSQTLVRCNSTDVTRDTRPSWVPRYDWCFDEQEGEL